MGSRKGWETLGSHVVNGGKWEDMRRRAAQGVGMPFFWNWSKQLEFELMSVQLSRFLKSEIISERNFYNVQ